jgi:hypothetical protein
MCRRGGEDRPQRHTQQPGAVKATGGPNSAEQPPAASLPPTPCRLGAGGGEDKDMQTRDQVLGRRRELAAPPYCGATCGWHIWPAVRTTDTNVKTTGVSCT